MIINPTGALTEEKAPYTNEEVSVTPGYSSSVAKPTASDGLLTKVTVKGDSNLTPENIRKGVTIFGVTGTYANLVTKNYNLGAFKYEWAYNEGPRYTSSSTVTTMTLYKGVSYSGTKITAEVDSQGDGTYTSTDGTWDHGTMISFSGDDLAYMGHDPYKVTVDATAETDLPDGYYNVELIGSKDYQYVDNSGQRGTYTYEFNGDVILQDTKMHVSNGTATISVYLEANNYGWYPGSNYTIPDYELVMFAVRLV